MLFPPRRYCRLLGGTPPRPNGTPCRPVSSRTTTHSGCIRPSVDPGRCGPDGDWPARSTGPCGPSSQALSCDAVASGTGSRPRRPQPLPRSLRRRCGWLPSSLVPARCVLGGGANRLELDVAHHLAWWLEVGNHRGRVLCRNRQRASGGYQSNRSQLSLIHISEPTRLRRISYAVFCLKKKKK